MLFLEESNHSIELLYSRIDLPFNFLKEPNCWVEAKRMEHFLTVVNEEFSHLLGEIVLNTGHQARSLKGWGALDSVLRLLQDPKDLFLQPQRFFSYFISPAPPVGNLQHQGGVVSFEIPISNEQYPWVSVYLQAALEALPTFVGKSMASVSWKDTMITIDWQVEQPALFEDSGTQVKPQLIKTLVESVERAQKEIEEKNRELLIKNQELDQVKKELESYLKKCQEIQSSSDPDDFIEKLQWPIGSALNNIWRLKDYLARSQQLITLLIGQGRLNSQVNEAIKRVNWSFVSEEYPNVIQETVDTLEKIQGFIVRRETDVQNQ